MKEHLADRLSKRAYLQLIDFLVDVNIKYGHLYHNGELVTQSITQTDAEVESVSGTESSPQPVRNRRRRRHTKCAEESAASI